MALGEEQQAALAAWLESKGLDSCRRCGETNWQPADIVSTPLVEGGGMRLGGNLMPMVRIVCRGCGGIDLFAAEIIGVTP